MFFSGGQKRTENTSTAADEDAADNRTQFRERPMQDETLATGSVSVAVQALLSSEFANGQYCMDSGRGRVALFLCCMQQKSFFLSTVLRTALQHISLQTGPIALVRAE